MNTNVHTNESFKVFKFNKKIKGNRCVQKKYERIEFYIVTFF